MHVTAQTAKHCNNAPKDPCCTGESNLCQHCTWIFSPTFYQLIYPTQFTPKIILVYCKAGFRQFCPQKMHPICVVWSQLYIKIVPAYTKDCPNLCQRSRVYANLSHFMPKKQSSDSLCPQKTLPVYIQDLHNLHQR